MIPNIMSTNINTNNGIQSEKESSHDHKIKSLTLEHKSSQLFWINYTRLEIYNKLKIYFNTISKTEELNN
jgi:hypothetical protein